MKETLNYDNKIIKRELRPEPLLWSEVDNNFRYGNTWETGVTYDTGMTVLWNDHLEPTFNDNGCLSYWICTSPNTSSWSNVPGSGNTYWDVISNPNAETLNGSGSTYYLYNSFRNLISNEYYSNDVSGYQYTNGFYIQSGEYNTKTFSRGKYASNELSKIKSIGYYSISFWYKVEGYTYDPPIDNITTVIINGETFGTIVVNSNNGWTNWTQTKLVSTLIDSEGYIQFIGSFEFDIIISDLVVNRSTSPSQTYFPSPDDLIKYNPNGNIGVGVDVPVGKLDINVSKTGTLVYNSDIIGIKNYLSLNLNDNINVSNYKGIETQLTISNNSNGTQSFSTVNSIKTSRIGIYNNTSGSIDIGNIVQYRAEGLGIYGGNITVNNAYMFYSQPSYFDPISTVTNFYGLYLAESTGSINNYGIYQDDIYATNVFKGRTNYDFIYNGDFETFMTNGSLWYINPNIDISTTGDNGVNTSPDIKIFRSTISVNNIGVNEIYYHEIKGFDLKRININSSDYNNSIININQIGGYQFGGINTGYANISESYGLWVDGSIFDNNPSSYCANYYGLYLGATSGSDNNYGIYQDDSTATNLFKGYVNFDNNIYVNNVSVSPIELSYVGGTTSNIQTQLNNIKGIIPKLSIHTNSLDYNNIYVKHELLNSYVNSLNPKIVLMHKVSRRYDSGDTIRYDEWTPYNSNIIPKVLAPDYFHNTNGSTLYGGNTFNYDLYDATFYRYFNPNIGLEEAQLSLYDVNNTTLPYLPNYTTYDASSTFDTGLTIRNIVGHRIYKKTLKSDGSFLSLTIFNDRKKKSIITNNTALLSELSTWELKHGKTIKINKNLVINNYGLCIRIDDPSNVGKYIYGEVCKFGVVLCVKDNNATNYTVKIII